MANGRWLVVTTSHPASWVFTVKTATGVVVRTQSGGPATTAAPTWNGRNTAGTLQSGGVYTWSLTLTDAAGYPSAVTLPGTVYVRARAVAVTVKASRFSSDVTTNGFSTVSWSSVALPPYATGYTISRRQVFISSTGRRTYGAATVWLRNTRLKTAKLYVPAGAIYQVLVTVADSAPIRAVKPVASVTTASPLDDRAFKFSPGWSSRSSSSSYRRTLKYAATKGKTATRTVYGSTIRILGLKCKKCGSITVTVDGRRYAVSTYASSTRARQTLFSATRAAGRHVIKFTVSGTKGRPGVWLDGLGATA
jgi:hypothetical protein